MDPANKQILLENLHLKYKEMEPLKKKIFLEKQAVVYKTMVRVRKKPIVNETEQTSNVNML